MQEAIKRGVYSQPIVTNFAKLIYILIYTYHYTNL